MSQKRILDLQLGTLVPGPLNPGSLPFGYISQPILIKKFFIVPTLDINLNLVDYAILSIYNNGDNNNKNELIGRWTNKQDEPDAMFLNAWMVNEIFDVEYIMGQNEILKSVIMVGGLSVDLGYPFYMMETENL